MPAELLAEAQQRRKELVERLADVDEVIGDMFLMEEEPSVQDLKAAVRRATIKNVFVPVCVRRCGRSCWSRSTRRTWRRRRGRRRRRRRSCVCATCASVCGEVSYQHNPNPNPNSHSFMGAAYKNKGVQLVLDAVAEYLPCPSEKQNVALKAAEKTAEAKAIKAAAAAATAGEPAADTAGAKKEAKVPLESDSSKPLVALAFKLEEGRFGQLTYMRV